MDPLQTPPPTLNSMADQSDYSIPNRSIPNSPVHSSSQIAECDSKFPEPQAQCKGSGKEASMDFTTSGISQKILTRISGSTLSENLNYTLQNYPSVTDTLSPITSPTPTMEADSSVMSPSENILCVGRRVLAAWDRFRYHNGVILRIDDEGIQVAFDMGDLKTYPLDCKDKIVIDRKALAHELVKDIPVLVRLPRRKALYKGRVHSSGTIRGYCILFDDTRRDRVWKRTKSLRVVTDYVVVKGSSKLDRDTTVDTSCTNEETIDSSLFSVTSKDRSTLDLPSQSILQDEVPGDIQCVPKQPKIFHSGFPTMVHYDGQSTVLRFPESTTDDQRIASGIQTHEELPVQQSSHLYSPVTVSLQSNTVKSQCRLQSNMAGSRPNLIGFQSNVFGSRSDLGESSVIDTQSNLTSFQSKVPDSRSNLTSFQSGFPGSRSNLTSFQSNVADPRSDLTSFQSNIPGSRSHLTSYHSTIGSQSNQADFQSKFTQDIFNYFPRRRHVSSSMQRRNVDFSGRNIHSPIIYTGQHNQCLIPSYIGRKTANRNALYYSQPSHSITPSPFTVAARDHHVFVPIHRTEKQLGCGDTSETFSHGTEETRRVHRPICSSMVSNQGRESVLSEYSSDFWPSSGTTDEKSSCSFQDYVSQEVCTANESSHLSNSSGIAEFNQNMASTTLENAIHTTIKQEPTSPSSFIDSSQINTLSNLPLPSPDDTQCYRRFDSPEDVSPEEYFHGVLSTCSTPRPTCVMEPEQMMEDQYAMSTTDRMGPTYTIPPACQTAPAYSALPAHLTPTADPTTPTYSIQPDNLTQPAYSIPYGYPTQPAYPTQPTRLTTPAQPVHPTQPANLSTPAYLTTSGLPACSRIPIYSIGRMEPNSYMPFITKVECSAQLESSSQTKKSFSNSQEYEPEWLYGINSVKPTTVIHYLPTGESYTLQTSQVSDKNTKYNRRCSPEANVQPKEFCTSENVSSAVSFGSQPSDSSHLVKFPLTREERKRKILSAFGFNNFEMSSSSCKTRTVEEEETVRPNEESKETKQIKGVQYSSYGESSSTTGENSSGCMVNSNLDQVCALSPSVVKAATILSNSCLQRWKTLSNLKSSVKRSLSPSFDETSATKYKKRSDSCNTNQLRENKRSVRDEIGKGENGNGVGTSGSTFQKGTKTIDQAKKDKNDAPSFPLYDEVTTYNVSSTHKTVAIQLRSKDTKPLRRPRICIQRQSTASQTQQANPSDTVLLDENKKGKKIHSFYKTAIEMSPSIESTDVEKIQDEKSNDNKSILIGESEGTEGLPLVAREVEVRTTSSVSVNTQQFNNQFTLTLSVEDENEEEGSPSDVSKPSSGSLNTRESKQSTIIAIVETEGKEEGSPLVARVVEVCTTSSESVNTQQKISEDTSVTTSKNIVENNTKLPLLSDTNGSSHSAQEFVTADANVSRTAQESTASFGLVQSKLKSVESQSNDSSTVEAFSLSFTQAPIRKDSLTEGDFGDINLRCDEVINETDIDQPNTNTSPKAKKSKEEMTVHLQITSQQIKFIDEATILLYSEAPPLRFLTCL